MTASGSADSAVSAGGAQLRSTRYNPPSSPGRAVPVTVDDDNEDDLESAWTAKTNGVGSIVTSSSDVDDNSSSLSSSVADPFSE